MAKGHLNVRTMKTMIALFSLALGLSVVIFLGFHLKHRRNVRPHGILSHLSTGLPSVTFSVNDVIQSKEQRAFTADEEYISNMASKIKETNEHSSCVYEIYREKLKVDPDLLPNDPKRAEWLAACQGPAGLVDADAHSAHPNGFLSDVHENGFVAAVSTSFADHYPLSLRPEHIWALILQAVAAHVNERPEELRHKFVTHKGKMDLTVRRDNFRLHERGNDWAGVVRDFSKQIEKHTIQDTVDLLKMDFSTTTEVERVCGHATIMNVVQQYFDFKLQTVCGYPRITLEGSLDDWMEVRTKAEKLVNEKCTDEFARFWLPSLLPVLERFVEQYKEPGEVDVEFWQSMAKRGGLKGSGAFDWLNGWFNVFFPILKDQKRNPFCVPYSSDKGYAEEVIGNCPNFYSWGSIPEGAEGPDLDLIPSGYVSTNVQWEYFDMEVPLQFRSGFLGAEQRPDGTISPALGWYIRYGNE